MIARIPSAVRNTTRHFCLTLYRRASVRAVIPPSSDDIELVSLFDQPQKNGGQSRPLSVSGIFQHPELTNPAAFNVLAESTLTRAQLLTERILRANQSRRELFNVVKNLDRLSDLLCGVIDLAELLRNAHPDPQWVQCANDSYEKLCEYMNVLNTHVGLYQASWSLLSLMAPNVAIDFAHGP